MAGDKAWANPGAVEAVDGSGIHVVTGIVPVITLVAACAEGVLKAKLMNPPPSAKAAAASNDAGLRHAWRCFLKARICLAVKSAPPELVAEYMTTFPLGRHDPLVFAEAHHSSWLAVSIVR